MKHFQDVDGKVYSDRNPGATPARGEVEVQVVPLDAIVIDRADLPEVKARGPLNDGTDATAWAISRNGAATWARGWDTAAGLRDQGLRYLALAEYVNAPDEAQVRALAALVNEVEDDIKGHYGEPADGFARALVKRGVRVEVSKS